MDTPLELAGSQLIINRRYEMSDPYLKLVIPGNDYTLEISEKTPGNLLLEMVPNEDGQTDGGYVEIQSSVLLEMLTKVVGKRSII